MEKTIYQNTKILLLLKGLLLSYIVTAFVILILSFLMLKLNLTGAITVGGINFAYIISCMAGGFYVGKKVEQRSFLWGLIMGIFYFIIFMILSILMNQGTSLQMGNLFTVFLMCGVSGMLGGMIS